MQAAKRILSVGPLIITNPALCGENYFGGRERRGGRDEGGS